MISERTDGLDGAEHLADEPLVVLRGGLVHFGGHRLRVLSLLELRPLDVSFADASLLPQVTACLRERGARCDTTKLASTQGSFDGVTGESDATRMFLVVRSAQGSLGGALHCPNRPRRPCLLFFVKVSERVSGGLHTGTVLIPGLLLHHFLADFSVYRLELTASLTHNGAAPPCWCMVYRSADLRRPSERTQGRALQSLKCG